MPQANAWLLQLGNGFTAAIGERELLHLVAEPRLHPVPTTSHYCRQVLAWENRLLPVMDLGAWFTGLPRRDPPRLLAVVGYQWGDSVEAGALCLNAMPVRTQADDSLACDLPEAPSGWRSLANSCFLKGDQPVPVLDLQHLFSGALLQSTVPVPSAIAQE